MIRSAILVCSILFSFFLKAQKIHLEWEGTKVIDYGTYKMAFPAFRGEEFTVENGTVHYRLTLPNANKKVAVANTVWEKVSARDLFDVSTYNIPSAENFSTGEITNPYTGEKSLSINIAALRFDGSQAYRLSSFTLVPAAEIPGGPQMAVPKVGSTENPLKSGTFFKIKVDKSGVFKITAKFLRDNGINPSTVNPKNFRVYGNGGLMLPERNTDTRYAALQENAIQVIGEEDGVWDENDYALFYAQGPHGFNLYKSAGNTNGSGNRRTETRTDTSLNLINIYEDFAYYFINFDLGPGKRIAEIDAAAGGTVFTRFDEYQFINEEKYNIRQIGRIWTGDAFNGPKTVNFTTRSPIQPTDLIRFRSRYIGLEAAGTSMVTNFNGGNVRTENIPSSSKKEFIPLVYFGTVSGLSGNQFTFNFEPNTSANPNGKFYFDYAEVQYKEDLRYPSTQFNFRSYEIAETSGNNYTFSIADASAVEQVWQISDITTPIRKVNKGSGSTFTFGYNATDENFVNEFVAFKNADAFSPQFVGRIANQDLSGLQNVEYLMVTVPEMMGHAQRLANFYQGKYNVAVADVNQIYNEFSSGSKDVTAIRDFATSLNTAGQLKYIFILGDASYDYRGRRHPNSDIVPSYESEESGDYAASFVTDDYYGMTKPQNGDGATQLSNTLPDVPVGRLPAANVAEAKTLMDKTLAYNNALPGQSTPFGEWRMKLDFVVDDDVDNVYPFHNTVNSSIVNVFETGTLRKEYNVRKLYLDAFTAQTSAGGQRYPQVNQAITNDMGNSLYMFYFGHGGINGWAQERVLTIPEIQNFNNFNSVYSRFPFVSTITCEFTLWDDPATFSAGEQVIKSKQGGAAFMLTSSRAIGVGYGEEFSTILTKHIFELVNDDFISIGEAFLKAKYEKKAHPDHLKVNLLGDPATKLSRPRRLLVVDEVESPQPGVLRALDFVKVKGHVTKSDGSLDQTFSGRVAVNIFDKRLNKKTLNNDNEPKMLPVLQYTEEGGPIVKASGQAVNGAFIVEFYVPKDINYEVGAGRMLVYADNKSYDVFNNQPQQVGGINENGINDSQPPKAKLYMNNTNFADGGITDQNPTLLACVTDDTGINSTGSGIGHDITVILDGKIIDTVVLNDFFFSGDGNGCTNPALADYQKGSVTYPFRNLAPGNHQLTFKVWDINNNSTTETLNFVVKDESAKNLVVNRVLNWPNPFTNKTYVQFEHNCDDILDVNVQIYTITGKLVRTLSANVTAEPFFQGFRTPRTAIEWDGKDDFGATVGKGTYIFKVLAKSQNQEKCKGTASAVEKMVLLK